MCSCGKKTTQLANDVQLWKENDPACKASSFRNDDPAWLGTSAALQSTTTSLQSASSTRLRSSTRYQGTKCETTPAQAWNEWDEALDALQHWMCDRMC